jgi:ribulose-phosphate 3-epimerase
MTELIPSLLVESKTEFERKLRLVEHACKTVHVDILDGTLFPNTTWFDAASVGAMATNVRYELHLMVENPLPIIEDWKRHVKQTQRAIVHSEMHRPIGAVISHIRDMLQLEAGVALNPETPFSEAHEVLHELDQLTVMGVHPGQSGQAFLGDYLLEKIAEIRNHAPNLPIEIDGGVTRELLPRLIKAGARRICAASLVFDAKDPAAALQEIASVL